MLNVRTNEKCIGKSKNVITNTQRRTSRNFSFISASTGKYFPLHYLLHWKPMESPHLTIPETPSSSSSLSHPSYNYLPLVVHHGCSSPNQLLILSRPLFAPAPPTLNPVPNPFCPPFPTLKIPSLPFFSPSPSPLLLPPLTFASPFLSSSDVKFLGYHRLFFKEREKQ